MARRSGSEKTGTYLTPRSTRRDRILVSSAGLGKTEQTKHIKSKQGERTVIIEQQKVYELASLGMSREMIAASFTLDKAKFKEVCDDYPEVEEAYLMGYGYAQKKVLAALWALVESKQMIATIYLSKVFGFIEADKLIGKDGSSDNAPKVHIYLPDNGRDSVTIENDTGMVDDD
jgi:hypothetical protein